MKYFLKSLLVKLSLIFCALFLLSTQQSAAYTFTSTQGKEIKSDSVIKILAIGNSFSEDAIEHFLYPLAKAGGHKVIIGNLYIGGAELALHWKNASENNATYSYRKIDEHGKKVTQEKISIAYALADERWDYISFQQVSSKSGLYTTYTKPLPALMNYVKASVRNPHTKYVLHQTWAYAQNSTHKGFINYGNSQKKMYNAIVKTTKKVENKNDFDLLIPNATAIQNARTSFIGDNMNRDGYHLNLVLGRYTASCTWYEKIFNENVVGNTFRPEKLSTYEADMAQNAAHFAVLNPFKVTKLKAFKLILKH